jgi:hypothetical protein
MILRMHEEQRVFFAISSQKPIHEACTAQQHSPHIICLTLPQGISGSTWRMILSMTRKPNMLVPTLQDAQERRSYSLGGPHPSAGITNGMCLVCYQHPSIMQLPHHFCSFTFALVGGTPPMGQLRVRHEEHTGTLW